MRRRLSRRSSEVLSCGHAGGDVDRDGHIGRARYAGHCGHHDVDLGAVAADLLAGRAANVAVNGPAVYGG
ncbi:hypothetical protein [Amycolatopsis plumensis]|uniref:hypothetical protein n=1 Tax=Amycolatopsis plumensis TaxID=236508 RepID=UPI0036147315